MMNAKRLLFLLIITCLYSGLQAQSIQCYRLKAPKVAVQAGQKIAVVEFYHKYDITNNTGNQGKLLANYVAKSIEEQNRHAKDQDKLGYGTLKTDFHTIISRNSVDSVVKALQIELSAKTSDDDLFRIGEALAVDLVLYGGNQYTIEREYYEKQTKTSEETRITQHVDIKVRCATHSNLYAVEDKSVTNLQIAIGHGSSSSSFAGEQNRAKTVANLEREVTKQAYREAANRIVDRFVPYLALDYARFENTKNKKYQKELKKSLRKSKIDEAYQVLQKIVSEDENNAAALYNLGLLNELVGNYARAFEFYEKALVVDEKYDKAKDQVAEILEACQTFNIPTQMRSFDQSEKLSQSR